MQTLIQNACVAVAATHRLTTLVVDDEVTRPAREWIAERYPDSKFDYLVNCPACASVWTAGAVLLAPKPLRNILALSAGVLAVKWFAEVTEAGVWR